VTGPDLISLVVRLVCGAFALFGFFVVGTNYWTIFENGRRHRLGISGHVSMVPFAGPLIVTIAWVSSRSFVQGPLAAVVAVAWAIDPATWLFAGFLLFQGTRRLRRKSSQSEDRED
jgi:hypothetical protein